MKIYDSHSHLGNDAFHPINGDIETYKKILHQNKISIANVMPVPCPVYQVDEKTKQALFWDCEKKSFRYYLREKKDGKWINVCENPENPYAEYNQILADLVKESSSPEYHLRFIPLVHPLLDTPEYLEKLLYESPFAIKIHGIASGISPKEITKETLRIIRKSNTPVIVHTDNSFNPNLNPFNYLRRENRAINWINLFERKGIRAFIAHGAYLCPKSFERINKSGQFLLGIGPELLMEDEEEKPFLIQKKPYLESILTSVNKERIAFDVDFPWNLKSAGNLELDNNPVEKIMEKKLSKSELDGILSSNALHFFGFLPFHHSQRL